MPGLELGTGQVKRVLDELAKKFIMAPAASCHGCGRKPPGVQCGDPAFSTRSSPTGSSEYVARMLVKAQCPNCLRRFSFQVWGVFRKSDHAMVKYSQNQLMQIAGMLDQEIVSE